MKIEKHIHYNENYDDWTILIIVCEKEDYETIEYGTYSSKVEGLNILNEAAKDIFRHKTLQSLREELKYYENL